LTSIRNTLNEVSSGYNIKTLTNVNTQDLLFFARYPIKTVGMHFLRDKIYYAHSERFKSLIDPMRIEGSKGILEMAGGESITLQTEDKVKIDAMFFAVDEFRKKIQEYGGEIRSNSIYFTTSLAKKFFTLMKVDFKKVASDVNDPWFFVNLNRSIQNPFLNERPNVMILTQGNAGIYEFNRINVSRFLLKGLSVMVFNIRGTGNSEGIPTEDGTYLDIEAIYQYLKKKGYNDEQISVYGYCLGSGYATDLAVRHPGVNLYLDRAAAKLSDFFADYVENAVLSSESLNDNICTKLSRWFIRFVFSDLIGERISSYNNAKKITKIIGKIFVIHGDNDLVIPPWSSLRLHQECRKARASIATPTALFAEVDHQKPLPEAAEVQLNNHMEVNGESNMRNFPETVKNRKKKIREAEIGDPNVGTSFCDSIRDCNEFVISKVKLA
jgi:pimeloyl-ACP methyl ester carboxylesterase